MEQKKILWIVVAVSVFVLIIFGTALFLYAPSRSNGSSLQQAASVAPSAKTDGSQTQIDPDSWVREPGKKPGLDTGKTPAAGDINLTIVNGDNAGAKYGTMDVSGLTSNASDQAPVDQTATQPQGIPGQDNTKTSSQTTTVTTATASTTTGKGVKTGATAVTTTKNTNTTVTRIAAKPETTKQAPAKAAVKKTVAGPEYWIQTGSFTNKLNAEKARDSLAARYLNAEIFTKDTAGNTNYRVRVGPYKTKAEADYWLGTVKGMPEFANSYVSEIKPKK